MLVLFFVIITREKDWLFFFSAQLEAGIFRSPVLILNASWLQGYTPRTEREAVFRESFGINHLLSDDDRNDTEVFIDILVDLLGVVPSVQKDVSKREIRITSSQFIEQRKNRILIGHTGRGNDGCHGDAVDGSEAVGLVAHRVLVSVMPFPVEGDAFVLESPAPLVIFFAFGRTTCDQECRIGNQDDSLLPMFRQIWNLRFQLIAIVLGVIYQGIATPTEAAAVGAVGAIFCAGVRKQLNRTNIKKILHMTVSINAMVFWIILAAVAYARLVTVSGVGEWFSSSITDLPVNRWVILSLMQVIFFFLGMVLDPAGILWIINMNMAYLTPPFGFSLFVLQGVAPPEVTTEDIYIGIWPYVGLMMVGLILVMLYPSLVTWLPGLMIK